MFFKPSVVVDVLGFGGVTFHVDFHNMKLAYMRNLNIESNH